MSLPSVSTPQDVLTALAGVTSDLPINYIAIANNGAVDLNDPSYSSPAGLSYFKRIFHIYCNANVTLNNFPADIGAAVTVTTFSLTVERLSSGSPDTPGYPRCIQTLLYKQNSYTRYTTGFTPAAGLFTWGPWSKQLSAFDMAVAGGYTNTQTQFNSDLASLDGLANAILSITGGGV